MSLIWFKSKFSCDPLGEAYVKLGRKLARITGERNVVIFSGPCAHAGLNKALAHVGVVYDGENGLWWLLGASFSAQSAVIETIFNTFPLTPDQRNALKRLQSDLQALRQKFADTIVPTLKPM